ncbi:MAG TPA: type VI secretion system baseplate subunit TssE [Candidatus Entotheonella sp.]|jgi:type VI secretion system protein ImpF
MADAGHNRGILPSVLDRLLDDQSEPSQAQSSYHIHSLDQVKQAVTRDLEALLNTRRERFEDLPPEFTEARQSLVNYGLPDFSALSLQSLEDRNRIRRVLEQTIALFEPRLTRVRVTLEALRAHEQTLRFRIDAMLRVEPAPEPVTFDAMLLNTQEYVVQDST